MSGIGLVHNPNAKQNKNRHGMEDTFARLLGDLGIVRVTEKPDEISEVAREFLDREIDILVVSGGDLSAFGTGRWNMPSHLNQVYTNIRRKKASTDSPYAFRDDEYDSSFSFWH